MIEEPPLLRINTSRNRPTPAQIAAFDGVPTGFVCDALGGGGSLAVTVMPGQGANVAVAGPALTADCGPADILATLASLKFITPGDVVVSAFGGHTGCAAAGDRATGMMQNCGAVGFVTDGPVRDAAGILEVGMPVWCNGLNPASPYGKGPGAVGFPVQIAGQRVASGDMIVADRDGVVVVPYEQIEAVIDRIARVRQLEQELDAEVAAGLKVPPAIEALLASDQVSYED